MHVLVAGRRRARLLHSPEDHYNCPIGSYTHHIALPKDREHELTDTLC